MKLSHQLLFLAIGITVALALSYTATVLHLDKFAANLNNIATPILTIVVIIIAIYSLLAQRKNNEQQALQIEINSMQIREESENRKLKEAKRVFDKLLLMTQKRNNYQVRGPVEFIDMFLRLVESVDQFLNLMIQNLKNKSITFKDEFELDHAIRKMYYLIVIYGFDQADKIIYISKNTFPGLNDEDWIMLLNNAKKEAVRLFTIDAFKDASEFCTQFLNYVDLVESFQDESNKASYRFSSLIRLPDLVKTTLFVLIFVSGNKHARTYLENNKTEDSMMELPF